MLALGRPIQRKKNVGTWPAGTVQQQRARPERCCLSRNHSESSTKLGSLLGLFGMLQQKLGLKLGLLNSDGIYILSKNTTKTCFFKISIKNFF